MPSNAKETESFCCSEFQCGRFLLDAVADVSPESLRAVKMPDNFARTEVSRKSFLGFQNKLVR